LTLWRESAKVGKVLFLYVLRQWWMLWLSLDHQNYPSRSRWSVRIERESQRIGSRNLVLKLPCRRLFLLIESALSWRGGLEVGEGEGRRGREACLILFFLTLRSLLQTGTSALYSISSILFSFEGLARGVSPSCCCRRRFSTETKSSFWRSLQFGLCEVQSRDWCCKRKRYDTDQWADVKREERWKGRSWRGRKCQKLTSCEHCEFKKCLYQHPTKVPM